MAGQDRTVSSGRNDLVYLAPATEPYEAMPLGNGDLGVMVRNGRDEMCYLFNHGGFFASRDQNQLMLSSGEFTVTLPDAWMKGFVEQRLVLHDGMIVTRFATDGTAHEIRSWMAEGLDVLVVEIESGAPLPDLPISLSVWDRAKPTHEIVGTGGKDYNDIHPVAEAGGPALSLTTVGLSGERAVALQVAELTGVAGRDGKTGERLAAMTTPADGGKKRVLLVANPLTVGTELEAADALKTAQAAIEQARAAGIETLRRRHNEFWRDFWSRSTLLMHSEDGLADYIENLYHLHLYWMAGMSRGEYAPKFNGGNSIFYNDWRSWGGGYWYQNTRELFWPALPANHPELMKPFLDLYWDKLPFMRKLAREFYDAPGACFEETMQRDGTGDKANNPYTHLYLTTGTELGRQFYSYYLYTGDEDFLRERAYPMLKETLTFHLAFVNKEDDGKYHVYPCNARETYWFVKNSTPDLTALRATLPILIETSRELGVDADLRPHWEDVLANLAPFAREPDGTLAPAVFLDEFPPTRFKRAEELYSLEPTQSRPRGARSLAARRNAFNSENTTIEPPYPWGLITLNSPAGELEMMRRTFLRRPHKGWGNGWEWSSVCAARLGMAEEVEKSLRAYATGVQALPNGMARTPGASPELWGKVLPAEPGFDTSGVLATTAAEINLQSHGGILRVFPALLEGWAGEFTLLGEGGFRVSSRRDTKGTVAFIRVESLRGGLCRVFHPWRGQVTVTAADGATAVAVDGTDILSFDTRAGATYELRPATAVDVEPPLVPVRNDAPKWPLRTGPANTAEAYDERAGAIGFLGITHDGRNPARQRVAASLAAQKRERAKINRPANPSWGLLPMATPPTIDGALDDDAWRRVPTLPPFVVAGLGYAADEQTEAKLGYDERHLYLAVHCHESRMDRLVASRELAPHDGSAIFREDRIEVFLQPEGAETYWQLVFTAGGLQYHARVMANQHDPVKLPHIACAIRLSNDGWTIEAAIPFTALGLESPAVGATWRGNVARDARPGEEISSWAPLTGGFHAPNEFGVLSFPGTGADLPLVWFDFEGDEARRWTDRSPFAWRGRLERGAGIAAGREGQVLELGNGGFLEVPDAADFQPAGNLAIDLWVKPSAADGRLVDQCTAGTSDGFTLDLIGGNHIRFITPHATVRSPEPIPLDQWTHIAAGVSVRHNVQWIAIPGRRVVRKTPIVAEARPTSKRLPLRFGADSNGGSSFSGQLDDIRIYMEAGVPDEASK